MIKSRDLQLVEAGYVADGQTARLLDSDEAVDAMASDTIAVLERAGFVLIQQNLSYGLQPLTGHTQNMIFRLKSRDHVRALIVISRSEFSAAFEELESAPKTNEFHTSNEDRVAVSKAASAVSAFARTRYSGRSVRVASYANPQP